MITCPKCQSIRIAGPRYVKLTFGYEALRYTCNQCGYEQDEKTADAKDKTFEPLRNLSGWKP